MSLPFQALIFDLDGTLADSLNEIGSAMNGALREHGLPEQALENYKAYVGDDAEQLASRSMPSGCTVPVKGVVDAYRLHYRRSEHANTWPYPGIDALLAALHGLRIPMAVLSNKRDELTKALVALRFPNSKFVVVRGERPGKPMKPDPSSALEIAVALGFEPSRIGFVGDTAIDMKTATAAGMLAIGVLWGFRGKAELLENGAKVLLAAPGELLTLPESLALR